MAHGIHLLLYVYKPLVDLEHVDAYAKLVGDILVRC